MKKGGKGGAKTKSGLKYENKVDLYLYLRQQGFTVRTIKGKAGIGVFSRGELVARCFRKNAFYLYLEEEGIDYKQYITRKLLPDDSLLVIIRKTLFIIEIKYQHVDGSTDEKLQTCDFKRKQFIKLVTPLGLFVEYVYILNDYFKQERYKDVLAYIQSVNCKYVFGPPPLEWFGLTS